MSEKNCLVEAVDEFDEKMCKKFPKIFANRFKPMTETCMCWGFSVGPGWYKIIEEACEKLQLICDKFGVQVVADQVKEKFGTLRFYVHYVNEDSLSNNQFKLVTNILNDVVNDAERKTEWTCEECGEYGESRGGGWIVTLCDKCYEKKKK